MNALKKIPFLILLFCIFPSVFFSQQSAVVNGWGPIPDSGLSWIEIQSSTINGTSQEFIVSGGTIFQSNMHLGQGTYLKNFAVSRPTPEKISVKKARCKESLALKNIEVFVGLQDSLGNYCYIGSQSQYIPLDGTSVTLTWNISAAIRSVVKTFNRVYLAFCGQTNDSCYMRLNVPLEDLVSVIGSVETVLDFNFNATAVANKNQIPEKFALLQNYPNPFNPSTVIKYSVPTSTQVSLKVYDLTGKEVGELVNDYKTAGNYEAKFNASRLSSGMYMYRLQAGNYTESKKMLLVK